MIWLGIVVALASGAPRERSVLEDLEQLDRALLGAERQLDQVEAERSRTQKEIARLEADQAVVTTQRQSAYARFQHRLRALARLPVGARLVLLGGSRSLADYLEMTRLLRWVAAHDRRLHEHYVEASDRLHSLTATLEERQEQLLGLETAQRSRRDDLAQRRQERLDLLTLVVKDKKLAERAATEHSAAGRDLAETVRKLKPSDRQNRDFAKNHGRLPWPAVGPVVLKFGQNVERTFGTSVTQNGLEIRAKAGARVQAVATGRVVFADWLRGYGQIVIVDHGDGYHSLVAHLGTIEVKTEDEVEPGSSIGTVGDTGSLSGTVLYFEIRQRGVPVDPLLWLRR